MEYNKEIALNKEMEEKGYYLDPFSNNPVFYYTGCIFPLSFEDWEEVEEWLEEVD